MSRTDRLRRLDRVLGRVVYGAAGLVTGAMALGAGLALRSAVEATAWGAAALFGVAALAMAALTAYCFSRDRRLTDLER